MTGARPTVAAAVRGRLVRVGTVGARAAGARVHRRTAPVELRGVLQLLLVELLLLLLVDAVLGLVHVPLDALLPDELGQLLAVAQRRVEQGVRVTSTAATAQAVVDRGVLEGAEGSLLEWGENVIAKKRFILKRSLLNDILEIPFNVL